MGRGSGNERVTTQTEGFSLASLYGPTEPFPGFPLRRRKVKRQKYQGVNNHIGGSFSVQSHLA